MGTGEDDVVLVATLGCSDDVAAPESLRVADCLQGADDLLPGKNGSHKSISILATDATNSNIGTFRTRRTGKGARDGTSGIVVKDGTSSTGGTSVGYLETEFTRATLDECNLALDSLREVRLPR